MHTITSSISGVGHIGAQFIVPVFTLLLHIIKNQSDYILDRASLGNIVI